MASGSPPSSNSSSFIISLLARKLINPEILLSYQTVSWSTSVAPLLCWIWPLGASAASGTSLSCHILVGQWCRSTASSAVWTVCHLCAICAEGSWLACGHRCSWSSSSADWSGCSCTGLSWVHLRSPHTSTDSWCWARSGEELLRTTEE